MVREVGTYSVEAFMWKDTVREVEKYLALVWYVRTQAEAVLQHQKRRSQIQSRFCMCTNFISPLLNNMFCSPG